MENKEVVQQYIEKVINTGEVDLIENYISPDYIETYQGKQYELGIEGARNHIMGVRKTYPDLVLTIDLMISEGDWVVTSYTATGTFENEWLGMQPTHQRMTYTGVNINKVVNGLIVEHGGAANLFEPLLEAKAIQIRQ